MYSDSSIQTHNELVVSWCFYFYLVCPCPLLLYANMTPPQVCVQSISQCPRWVSYHLKGSSSGLWHEHQMVVMSEPSRGHLGGGGIFSNSRSMMHFPLGCGGGSCLALRWVGQVSHSHPSRGMYRAVQLNADPVGWRTPQGQFIIIIIIIIIIINLMPCAQWRPWSNAILSHVIQKYV